MSPAKPPAPEPILDRAEILSHLRERIFAFAASKLTGDQAEDLTQEVLLLLHEKYGHLTRLEDLLPLALQVMRFKLMSFRRTAQRHGEYNRVAADELPLADKRPDPEHEAARREMAERLAKAMAQLCERCRELFRLKLEGRNFAEIRTILGAASINTVYTWDFRCRQQLLELMGGKWEKGR